MSNPKPQVSYQEIIKQEYSKCAESPVYFMRHYVKIQHAMRGSINFDLFPFQEKTLHDFAKYKFNIILKSRQMGISTLVAAYSLWTMIFNKDKNILLISLRQDDAKDVIAKVQFANENLPTWLKVKCEENNRLSLKFSNGSKIKAASTTKKSGVGQALSLLIIDEAALIDEAEELWTSAQPTLSCLDKREVILTDSGLVRLENLITENTTTGFNDININVYTSTGVSKASHFYMSKKSDMYKITFESGASILATKNHPLMTKTGWKSVETLIPNEDCILSKYNQNSFGESIDYSKFNPDIRVDAKKYDMLSNDEIAYLCGLWVAEGHFLKNTTKGIGITNTDTSITDWLMKIGFKQCDDRHYTLGSVWMFELLKWIGCEGTSHTKRVPWRILSSSKREQIKFIQGLFDGDGCSLNEKGVKLTSVSYELLSNVRCMLLNFGIYSYIRNVKWKSTKSTVIKDKTKVFYGYELYIGGWDAHKFYNDIGFNLNRKQDGHKKLSVKSIKKIYPDKNILKSLILESGLTIREFSKKYNCYFDRYLWYGGSGVSVSSIKTLLDVSNNKSENYEQIKNQYIKDTTEYYDKIISVEFEKNDFSYDLKVPGEECFIANGYVNHNTGGSCIILSCVTKDTMVITNKGIQEIGNFVDNTKTGGYKINEYGVLGVDKIRYGNLFHNNGIQNTNILTTKFSSLECTDNHKLWAYKKSENKYGWYESSELRVGDYLSLQYNKNIWGNEDDIIGFNPSVSSKIHSPFNPPTLTPDLCYLLGLYISEGSVYKVINKNGELVGGSLTITCGDNISWIFDKLNLTYCCHDGIHYTISNKNLIEFMEYIGFDLSYKANKKQIPPKLLKMSKFNIQWLLRGIFDGDGCGTKKMVKLTSTSKKLIDQVRMILSNFGILSAITLESKESKKERKNKIKHNYDVYNIEIYGRYALRYYNIIGFNLERKQNTISYYLNQNLDRACSKNVIPGTLDLLNQLVDSSELKLSEIKKRHGIWVSAYCNSKTKYKTKNISHDNITTLYSLFSNNLDRETKLYWDNIINDNIVWCEIKSIIHSRNETFDFSLPDNKNDFWSHSVIYNGVIGHQTPRGMGNFFHKTWQGAEEGGNGEVGKNGFHPIMLPWNLHPERDEEWRRIEGNKQGSPKKASQEFDCNFLSSGDNVVDLNIVEFYRKNIMKEPLEVRGVDKGLWVWQYPDYSHSYIIAADVARGDGADYSGCHVLDITGTVPIQVAEYKGNLGTKDYGNFLVALATEYNNGLLIVERENVGWATLQAIIDRNYPNTFFSSADLKYVDVQRQLVNRYDSEDKKLVPGFSTNMKTRPLVINNIDLYFRDKAIEIYSQRTLSELSTFIWKGGKAQAMDGYNDDLIMSLGIGLWVRDTALRLRQEGIELTRATIGNINRNQTDQTPVFKSHNTNLGLKSWQMPTGRQGTGQHNTEDIRWLLS